MEQTESIQQSKLKRENDTLLFAMLGSKELVEKWWHSPNKGFDMAHPADVDPLRVQQYLISMAYGEW